MLFRPDYVVRGQRDHHPFARDSERRGQAEPRRRGAPPWLGDRLEGHLVGQVLADENDLGDLRHHVGLLRAHRRRHLPLGLLDEILQNLTAARTAWRWLRRLSGQER